MSVTELVFILDRSGSMSGMEKDTIGGFNSMIEKQKKQAGECYVSTVLFDNESEVVHDRVKLSEIEPMTEDDYYVRGCTALIDAVGGAIHHIGNIHKYARPEDRPAKTLFIITTDGMENASTEYNNESIKALVDRLDHAGWVFTYIGANQDAIYVANSMGIRNALQYDSDEEGTKAMWDQERNSRKAFYGRTQTIKSRSKLKRGYFEEDNE